MASEPTPVDPPQLHSSPAFAQGMIVPAGPVLHIGGQNGTDSSGALLDGLGAQSEQALRNVLAVLAEAGAGPEHVAKLTIYLDPAVDPDAAYAATRTVWGNHRTAVAFSQSPRPGRAPSSRSRRWQRFLGPEPRRLDEHRRTCVVGHDVRAVVSLWHA